MQVFFVFILSLADLFNQHEKNVYLEYQINKGINKIPPFDLFDIFKPKSILLEQNKSHIDENCDEIFNALYGSSCLQDTQRLALCDLMKRKVDGAYVAKTVQPADVPMDIPAEDDLFK
jgi:hypothetical protein